MSHIVLFGGTFDPIHDGHLQMMKTAIKQVNADEGWFILANQAPLKEAQQRSFDQRLEMLKIMIAPFKKLRAVTIEKEMPLPNYTINTILLLKKKYPFHTFNLLIGSDQATQFEKWMSYKELLKEVEVLVYPRDESPIASHFRALKGPLLEVSSTQIRKGQSVKTHPKILKIMIQRGYYADDMLSNYLGDKRQKHSFEVAKLMREFAAHYHLDEEYYYGLGVIHDIFKKYEKEHQLEWLLNSNDLKKPPYMWHAIACRNWLSRFFKIRDKRFTNAIYHHVLGTGHTTESMLLYISDKTERTRGYDSEPLIELTKLSIVKGFKAVKAMSQNYIQQKERMNEFID